MVSAEPAVWGETFWPQRPVSLRVNPLDIFRTDYSEDDLRWNSWAFWFNQTGHPAKSAVNNLVSSWVPWDFALVLMQYDECTVRNLGEHYDTRPFYVANKFRVPIEGSFGADDDLSTSKATMLDPDRVRKGLCTLDIVVPAGQAPNQDATFNVPAANYGWPSWDHSAFRRVPVFEIFPWYKRAFEGRMPLDRDH